MSVHVLIGLIKANEQKQVFPAAHFHLALEVTFQEPTTNYDKHTKFKILQERLGVPAMVFCFFISFHIFGRTV